MGFIQKLHGHSDGLIHRPRMYEYSAAIGFIGRRRRVYDDLLVRSGAQPGDEVLDIGCGTGYFSRRAARVVAPDGHVVGIDPSRPVIDYATRVAPATCTFQTARAEALPYPDASFDLVISSLAFHHLPPVERPTALRESYRVLRPGGQLLVADFRRRPLHNRIADSFIGALAGHTTPHNPIDQLASLIAQAGFQVTGSGDHWPSLHYVQAQRPSAGSASDARDRPPEADHDAPADGDDAGGQGAVPAAHRSASPAGPSHTSERPGGSVQVARDSGSVEMSTPSRPGLSAGPRVSRRSAGWKAAKINAVAAHADHSSIGPPADSIWVPTSGATTAASPQQAPYAARYDAREPSDAGAVGLRCSGPAMVIS
jgi:ubiquinone/menaquinone biosynthesis C-methylase UbiE